MHFSVEKDLTIEIEMILLFLVTGLIFEGPCLGRRRVKIIPFLVFRANGAGIFTHSANDIDCQLHTVTTVACEAFQLTVTIQESDHLVSNKIKKNFPDRKKGV